MDCPDCGKQVSPEDDVSLYRENGEGQGRVWLFTCENCGASGAILQEN